MLSVLPHRPTPISIRPRVDVLPAAASVPMIEGVVAGQVVGHMWYSLVRITIICLYIMISWGHPLQCGMSLSIDR